jgi:uncharacterized protein
VVAHPVLGVLHRNSPIDPYSERAQREPEIAQGRVVVGALRILVREREAPAGRYPHQTVLKVSDNPGELRYELRDDGELAGEIRYRRFSGGLALVHTEVEPKRKGLGTELVRGALDDMRARGLKVAPVCPFVAAYIRRHPEYADLVGREE